MKLYAAPLNFRAIAEEFDVPTQFLPQVREEARRAVDRFADTRRDARDIPLVTIDPVGSMDLDQAVHIERGAGGEGYVVHYAIADVGALVRPGGLVEAESLRRGQTIYLPDEPARLHPPELSEDVGSLLPERDRPAVLWTIALDSRGEVDRFHVERALVRSRARLDYEGVHQDLVAGRVHSSIALLADVGRLRQSSSLRREAISLRVPSQRVVPASDGTYTLEIEPRYEVMDYNSEISLLAGQCAGQLSASNNVGFLRTLPAASPEATEKFLTEAAALGYEVSAQGIPEFLLAVDADSPHGMAIMREAQSLLRGADYVWLEEGKSPGMPEVHAGIGGYYSHVTAPLRRLVDRFSTEVCLALAAGTEIPEWVRENAQQVAATMRQSSQLASKVDRACLDLAEATVLQPWVGYNFEATILSTSGARLDSPARSRAVVLDPPVFADVVGAPALGSRTSVSLARADVGAREVTFAWPAD